MNKDSLFTGQPVFTQLLNKIPRFLVDEIARKHGTDRYCKRFMSYDHLITMLYAGFFQCTSLSELITGLQANAARLNHLGLKHTPRKSTLADANQRRDESFFAELYHRLYEIHFDSPDSRMKKQERRMFIVDSTTISLFSEIMKGAGSYKDNGRKKGGVKAHMMVDAEHDIPAFIHLTEAREHDLVFLHKLNVPQGAMIVMDRAYVNYRQFLQWAQRDIKWVTRLKRDAYIRPVCHLPLDEYDEQNGVISDQLVVLGRPSNRRITPLIKARIIDYYDAEKNRRFSFITNDLCSTPGHIADLYRRRWQIEILFKRIKQRYPLKYFLGDNPNAIKIQIWAVLLCDLLVKIVQRTVNAKKSKPWAYASISSMIKHHLMTYIKLEAFLLNPERAIMHYRPPDGNSQLNLFDAGLS